MEVGALWDLAPHDLSILDLVGFGQPQKARCLFRSFRTKGVEDLVFGIVEYAGDRLAQLHLSWHSTSKIRDLLVVGGLKRARFIEESDSNPLIISESPLAEFDKPKPSSTAADYNLSDETPRPDVNEPLRNMVGAFTGACRSRSPPLFEIDRAMRVTLTIEAMESSARSEGIRVQVSSPPKLV